MIVELLQNIPNHIPIYEMEATIMYLGILVDTNRFKMHTDARTFEAAAALQNWGANTNRAEKALCEDYLYFSMKNALIQQAKPYYNHFMIAAIDDETLDKTMMAQVSQALLLIKGCVASFTIAKVSNSPEIKVVGIIKPSESTVSQPTMGGVYYTKAMEEYVTEKTENSQIVQEQKANPNINIFTQAEFASGQKMSMSNLTNEQMMQLSSMSQEELMNYMNTYNENINATYDSNLTKLGVVDYSNPTKISLYASSFDGKEKLGDLITSYNKKQTKSNVITYNDFIGTMLSSVTSVVNIISYVLIAFVSVSLIVSSIMIGIITYISVLERTKEIGILRSIGASKKDITRVFNAETFIIGLISGVLGILITLVLNVPISMVVENMTGVAHIAKLPVNGAVFLILIDLVLTILAGLIPSKIASKKDPVEALRSE